ncbi:hypothetical protein F4861DRAFT_545632 [Xylaria intraflava]|nr:hypothetical protein F4861DRAFT_545632 [Xylaria intraflava]
MVMSLIVESSIWYAITVLLTTSRFTSHKIILGSFRKLEVHDVLALLALATETALVVILNVLIHKRTNLFDPKHPPSLTPEDISERVFGSKLVVVSEQMQILTTWLVKAYFLLMYSNLTYFCNPQKLCVKFVAGYVALGFVLMEILYFGVWCRPFHQYWEVPPHSIQCATATNHLITNAVLNISSDVLIITIPMPILFQLNISPKKKAIFSVLFGLGFFTIGCAIASKYYSFHDPYGHKWTFWYIRESSTALIVMNMPFLWAIIRFFFKLNPLFDSKSSGSTTSAPLRQRYGHNMRNVSHSITITRGTGNARVPSEFRVLNSQEDLTHPSGIPLRIYKHQEVHVSREASGAREGSRSSHDLFDLDA